MSEELTPMDRMELWMSALNEAITNGTDNSFMPYNRYELWMKKLCEAILAKDPADPDVVEAFVNDWLDDHPEATTTVEDGAVTAAKLASDAVTTAKIKDGEVTDAKLAASGVKNDVSVLQNRTGQIIEQGKNLLPVEKYESTIGGLSVTYENGTIKRNGTATSSVTTIPGVWASSPFVLKAGSYIFTISNPNITTFTLRKASDGTLIANPYPSQTFTLAEDTEVRLGVNVSSGSSYTNNVANVQIEVGSTATAWEEPYLTAIDCICRNAENAFEESVNGGTYTLEKESVSQMYNGSSQLKTETATNKFYKVNVKSANFPIDLTLTATGGNNNHWYNEYDAAGNLLHAETISMQTATSARIPITDSDTSYIKISIWTDNGAFSLAQTIVGEIDKRISAKVKRFNYVSALGDSITNGLYYDSSVQKTTDNTYQKMLADYFGATFQKLGVNSTSISTQSNYESSANAFVNRYTQINENADYIIVAGGTNDWGHNTPMGDITDTTDVGFYGALDVLINGLISTYPNARIVFVTPFQRDYVGGDYDPCTGENGEGLTLDDYCAAMKAKCKQYGIQCVDGYSESGLNITATCKTNFMPDGLHPNPAGHAKIFKNLLHALM